MSIPSKNAVTIFKGACDRSQNWINVHVEKMAHCANRFSTVKTGYSKIRPRIFPKGLSTFQNQRNLDDFDEDECDNFLRNSRNRIHSVDVIDQKFRDNFKQQMDENSYISFEPQDFHGKSAACAR